MRINSNQSQSFKAVYVPHPAEDLWEETIKEHEKLYGKEETDNFIKNIEKCDKTKRYDIIFLNFGDARINIFDYAKNKIDNLGIFNPNTQIKDIIKTLKKAVDFVISEEKL